MSLSSITPGDAAAGYYKDSNNNIEAKYGILEGGSPVKTTNVDDRSNRG